MNTHPDKPRGEIRLDVKMERGDWTSCILSSGVPLDIPDTNQFDAIAVSRSDRVESSGCTSPSAFQPPVALHQEEELSLARLLWHAVE